MHCEETLEKKVLFPDSSIWAMLIVCCVHSTEPQEESGRVAGLNVTPYAAPQQSSAASALFRGMTGPVASATTSNAAVSEAAVHSAVSTVGQSTTAESTASGDDSRSDSASSASAKASPQVARCSFHFTAHVSTYIYYIAKPILTMIVSPLWLVATITTNL